MLVVPFGADVGFPLEDVVSHHVGDARRVQRRTVVSTSNGRNADALVSLSQKLQMSNLGDSQLGGRRTSPPLGVPDRCRFLLSLAQLS